MSKSPIDVKTEEGRAKLWQAILENLPDVAIMVGTGWFTYTMFDFLTGPVYGILGVIFAEGGWKLWKYLAFYKAENDTMGKIATTAQTLSMLFMLITGASAGVVLMHKSGYFDIFSVIPPSIQVWVAIAIPVMAIVQGWQLAGFYGKSDWAVTLRELGTRERLAIQKEREAEISARVSVAEERARRMAIVAKENAPKIGARKADDFWNEKYGNVYQAKAPELPELPEDNRPSKPPRATRS